MAIRWRGRTYEAYVMGAINGRRIERRRREVVIDTENKTITVETMGKAVTMTFEFVESLGWYQAKGYVIVLAPTVEIEQDKIIIEGDKSTCGYSREFLDRLAMHWKEKLSELDREVKRNESPLCNAEVDQRTLHGDGGTYTYYDCPTCGCTSSFKPDKADIKLKLSIDNTQAVKQIEEIK